MVTHNSSHRVLTPGNRGTEMNRADGAFVGERGASA